MLSFAFELNSSKDLWIRIHAAYLFTRLYSTGNSVGAGIFQQLLETEFCNRLEASPVMLHVCKMAILLLRIPWRQDNVQQRVDLVPVIVTTLMFLTFSSYTTKQYPKLTCHRYLWNKAIQLLTFG